MKNIKENITQVLLIIISVLIAFSVDRCYDNYKVGQSKQSFVEEQISQFEQEIESLDFFIEYNKKLIDKSVKALNHAGVDSIIFYSKGLPNHTDFISGFKNLNELREVYAVDKFLQAEEKMIFRGVYKNYLNVEYYESNFRKVITERFNRFWVDNYNSYNSSYTNKDLFKSDEYLNIIHSCKVQLSNVNKAYVSLKDELLLLIEKLKKT